MDLRRPSLTLCTLVVVALVVPSPAPSGAVQEGLVPSGVVAILTDRERAYVDHDPDLLAPSLAPGIAESELERLDHARAVPFDSFAHRPVTAYSGDLASTRIRRRYPGQEVLTLHVEERTRIGGIEPSPFVEDTFMTFTRAPGATDPYDGWRLASTTDLAPLGVHEPGHMWDAAPVEVRRSEHFLVLAHPDNIDEMGPLLDAAEAALLDVRAWWPNEPEAPGYVILAPSTTEELGMLLRTTVDLSKFVAFAGGSVTREGGWSPMGVRLYVNRPNFSRYDADGRREILAHELIHAVTRTVSGPHMPVWVEEGLAMAGSESGARSGLSGGRAPVGFPTDDEFFVGPTRDIVRTYRRSQVAVEVAIEHRDLDAFVAFYEGVGEARTAPGTSTYHVARSAEAALGWSAEEWRQAWLEAL